MDNQYHPNFGSVLVEKPSSRRRIWFLAFYIITSVILTTGGYVWYRHTVSGKTATANILGDNMAGTQNQDIDALVKEIGQFMQLPVERPRVAVVANLEKLKDQPFFAQAKVGDKLLIYTNAKKAILYDPINKRIINVSSVNVSSPM